MTEKRKVLLAPLDPVHDIGLKMIRRGLVEAGHETILLPPDLAPEEIIKEALDKKVDTILVSRTLGYGVAELLAKFVDLADAAGLREKVRIGIGGMAVRPELAAELGFDAGFGPGTTIEEALAFVEGREYVPDEGKTKKRKRNFVAVYDYGYKHQEIKKLLDQITDQILRWAENKTTPGIERAKLREQMMELAKEIEAGKVDRKTGEARLQELRNEYKNYCDDKVKKFYEHGQVHEKTRALTKEELQQLEEYVKETNARMKPKIIQHTEQNPVVFIQYGTGCPFMDIAHIKVGEAWGADGVVHFDPSWGARTEGFYEGYLTHSEDGSVITPENMMRIKESLNPSTLWQIRAHRGLNTPETVVIAGQVGADLTKINIAYGSLAAGTDPARLTADAIAAIKYAAKYNMPFDVVTNEELAGVPAHKAFAGMLITAHLGLKLGGKPILQPLFCYSPEVMIGGQMADNYVDFNAAKIKALRSIINAPIWPGAPIGFLTQTEDRVQSSNSTSLHAGLASALGVDAISIASSDEAYSGGPISAPARVDTLRAVHSVFRFFGHAGIQPTEHADYWAQEIVDGIEATLRKVVETGDFVQALYDGILGNREEGAYPGRNGRGTVTEIKN